MKTSVLGVGFASILLTGCVVVPVDNVGSSVYVRPDVDTTYVIPTPAPQVNIYQYPKPIVVRPGPTIIYNPYENDPTVYRGYSQPYWTYRNRLYFRYNQYWKNSNIHFGF
jgi:hypothetical protein